MTITISQEKTTRLIRLQESIISDAPINEVLNILDTEADLNIFIPYCYDEDDEDDIDDLTPLMITAFLGKVEIVQLLIKKQVNINLCKEGGWTAIMIAAANSHVEVVELLAQQSTTNINNEDCFGRTALTLVMMFLPHADKNKNRYIRTAEILIKSSGIDVNYIDQHGYTALMRTAYHGYIDLIKALISIKNININYTHQEFGWNACMFAASNNQTNSLEILLENNQTLSNIPQDNNSNAVKKLLQTGDINLYGKITRVMPIRI